jgi:tetratricopeptide (TPR) repeat protein
MAKFAYKAMDQSGKEVFGILDVETEAKALEQIHERGLFPTQVREAGLTDEWRAQWHNEKDRRKREEEAARRRVREARGRQRLVVHRLNGETINGVCYALNPRELSFYLDQVDEHGTTTGATEQIRYADLKAVFFVKSFDGKFDKNQSYREWTPEGDEVVVKFNDGEVIRGRTLHNYNQDDERFYLIPADTKTNNISILVVRSAVEQVYTPEEYEQEKAAKREARKHSTGPVALSQEETLGDFYFQTRNYSAAIEQYAIALKRAPDSQRLRKKELATEYNIGIQHIKRREYEQALAYMEKILKVDPGNSHAKRKALKLRKIIERGAGVGQDEGPNAQE